MGSIASQVAFITGATAGFGEEIARCLAADDVRIVAVGRRRERLDALKEELGERVFPLALDVRDRDAVTRAVADLPAPFDTVDVLVNNAGLALGLDAAPEADLDHWDTMVDTNVKGLMYVTRAILPGMVARGGGLVINLGSVAGQWPYPGSNVYGATKAFVTQFSYNLRSDLAGTGVRVTDLSPGLAETEFSLVRFEGDTTKAADVYRGTDPIRPADIAETVRWLVSLSPHLNVNRLEIMPVGQTFGPTLIDRN